MAQKLLLAEGLDLLRRTEAREYEADHNQARINSKSAQRGELSRLVEAYALVSQDYLSAAEIINYVRRCAKDGDYAKNGSLIAFCEGKMRACMDRCEIVRKKQDNILLPIAQVDKIELYRFQIAEPIFVVSGAQCTLKRKEPFSRQDTLTDGSYLFVVKNLDDFSVAVPVVHVVADLVPLRGNQTRIEKKIPQQCGWRRVIGVVGSARLQVMVRSDGLLRDSHVDISLHRLVAAPERPLGAQDALFEANKGLLPKISDDELELLANSNVPAGELAARVPTSPLCKGENAMEVLQTLNVPHQQRPQAAPLFVPERIQVSPAGKTCKERLRILRATLNTWPNEGVLAVPLNLEQQRVTQSVYVLPFPTELRD